MTDFVKTLSARRLIQDLAGASALVAMLYTGLLLPSLM